VARMGTDTAGAAQPISFDDDTQTLRRLRSISPVAGELWTHTAPLRPPLYCSCSLIRSNDIHLPTHYPII
jgi:hypothetical protein